jgi:RNA polymerase sigma factor (sigma-70 family)
MTDSQHLLSEFAQHRSESAFQELVVRYVDLVYSTALRLVEGDAHRAKDVCQTVFIDLAHMAAKLAPDSKIGGWLHRHTCLVARSLMRSDRRRQIRERHAAAMNALDSLPDPAFADLAPVLDETINELGSDDREVILLRFFEGHKLRSIGEALGVSENVAQKRVARALEELAVLLRRRGYVVPVAALTTWLTAEAVNAAPLGLAVGLTQATLASTGGTSSLATVTAQTALLAKLKTGALSLILLLGLMSFVWLQFQPRPSPPPTATAASPANPVQPVDGNLDATPSPNSVFTTPQTPQLGIATPNDRTRPDSDGTRNPPTPSAAPRSLPQSVSTYPGLPLQRLFPRPGVSRLRVEGTSSIHRWQAESQLVFGFLEVPTNSLLKPMQIPGPTQLPAHAEVNIPVRGLRSVESDGRLYSDRMDEIIYERLGAGTNHQARIVFHLEDLTFQDRPEGSNVALLYVATGSLAIAGVTNPITLPLAVSPAELDEVAISGNTSLRMSSFGIEPPKVNLLNSLIEVGDEVKVIFEWVVSPKRLVPTKTTGSKVPLVLDLPSPAFQMQGHRLHLDSGVEPPPEKPRAPLLVPSGLSNIASAARITSSDRNLKGADLAKITDGNKEAGEDNVVRLRKGPQWVQLDFQQAQQIFAVVVWHAHNVPKVYHGVIVQVADDSEFKQTVRTLFNNDHNNRLGRGSGRDREYVETYEGKLLDTQGAVGRCLRFYSNGSTESSLNEYTEIEVYGQPTE